ncbi:MAG: MFS transporter [Caldilineaceae bacterium SB0665_bin_25]|nr:MFS transporter [Caldilineaceae bacterium SB0665_bin_25]
MATEPAAESSQESARTPGPGDRREQIGWYFYDWANSAFATTVGAVFLGPYVSNLAEQAAGPDGLIRLFGVPMDPYSFFSYCITISVVLQVLFLPILGAIADYSSLRKRLMQVFAVAGSIAAMFMFFITDETWWLGGLLFIGANLCFGAAIVFYNAFLPDIAEPEDRDRVSSVGWALGYLGGGILLTLNLAFYLMHDTLGIDTGLAVRINLFSGGLWWFSWSFVTWRLLRSRDTAKELLPGETYLSTGLRQLWETFKEASKYPHTIRFLIAYLLYNDGIQTVFAVSAVFAAAPLVQGGLEIEQSMLTMVILMIQFVAFGGALLFGRAAVRIGAKKALIIGLIVWTVVVIYAYLGLKGESRILEFWILGAFIALVMGGTQAVSRGLFANMIPQGKEAEFFSIYEVSERGTSWLGPLAFGLVNQMTGSLRPAMVSIILFFVIGLVLLLRVDVRRAITESGNKPPAVV